MGDACASRPQALGLLNGMWEGCFREVKWDAEGLMQGQGPLPNWFFTNLQKQLPGFRVFWDFGNGDCPDDSTSGMGTHAEP